MTVFASGERLSIGWCPSCAAPRIEVGTGCCECAEHLLKITSPNVVDELQEALQHSIVAIDDWLASYASEYCDKDVVKAAYERLDEHGTLHYIATTQQRNREAIANRETVSVSAKTTETNEHK